MRVSSGKYCETGGALNNKTFILTIVSAYVMRYVSRLEKLNSQRIYSEIEDNANTLI